MSDDDPLFISESHRQTIARDSEKNKISEGVSWRWPVVKGQVVPADPESIATRAVPDRRSGSKGDE